MANLFSKKQIPTSSTFVTNPYKIAVAQVENLRKQAQQCAATQKVASPGPIGKLVIEETFSLLHQGPMYSGMGEEDISASFVASMFAACVMWRRHWIWAEDLQSESILWSHYSKKSETVLGADFSLILVDMEDGTQCFRMVVVQAKKHTANDPKRLHVERKAFSTVKGEEAPLHWETTANKHLDTALTGQALKEEDVKANEPNWQLTRLLALKQRLDPVVSCVYVIWPNTSENKGGPYNPVLYQDLSIVSAEIAAHKAKHGTLLQSFALDLSKCFRKYLLNYQDIGSMSETNLIAALQIAKAESAATMLINISGNPLSVALKSEFKPAAPTAYAAATYKMTAGGPRI